MLLKHTDEELLDGLAVDNGPDLEDTNIDLSEQSYLVEGEKAAKDGIKYIGRDESRNVKDKESAIPQSMFEKPK